MEREKTEVEEITEVDYSEAPPQRWCSVCNKYVKTKGKKKNICVNCGSFTAKYKPDQKEVKGKKEPKQEAESEKEKGYKISSLRPISLSGREMALAEILINAGLAKNLNDLTRKGLYVMAAMFNLPHGQKMEELNQEKQEEKPNPKKTLRELQEQKMIEAYINNMEKGNVIDPLSMMMLMRMMDNRDKGEDNNFMDKMLQLQMIRSISQPQAETHLSKELADLKYQLQIQQILQQAQNKNAPSLNEQMIALEKIRADRDEKIKAAEIQAQQERDKTLKVMIDSKLKDMEKQLREAQEGGRGMGASQLNEFRETLKAVKEMQKEIGERERSAGEYLSETVTNVASQLQPTLTKLIESKQKQSQIPAQVEESPAPQEPEPAQPLPQSDITETEREISDQMASMYIEKKNE